MTTHDKPVVLRTFQNGFYQIEGVPHICLDQNKGLFYLTPSVFQVLASITKQMQETDELVQVFPSYSETH